MAGTLCRLLWAAAARVGVAVVGSGCDATWDGPQPLELRLRVGQALGLTNSRHTGTGACTRGCDPA